MGSLECSKMPVVSYRQHVTSSEDRIAQKNSAQLSNVILARVLSSYLVQKDGAGRSLAGYPEPEPKPEPECVTGS